MEHEHVAAGTGEVSHVAHPGVERLAVQRHAPRLRDVRDAQGEGGRALEVGDGHGDEVRSLDLDHPTDPSIWSWMSRFISTAYSSGSSFVIGSTKPETIIADASASDRPRDIR